MENEYVLWKVLSRVVQLVQTHVLNSFLAGICWKQFGINHNFIRLYYDLLDKFLFKGYKSQLSIGFVLGFLGVKTLQLHP